MIKPVSKIFTLFAISIGATTVLAQDSVDVVDCQTAPRLAHSKNQTTVSFGVVNGKALVLVKPDYPPAARAVNVRGSVNVQVLIDSRGCIAKAKAVSGHVLLRKASENAALRSSFQPVYIGGKAIWCTGTIVYNYVSDTANWLEIGYFSTSREKLLTYLPSEFDSICSELNNIDSLSFEDQPKALDAAVEKIRTGLAGKHKEQWLFDFGSQLAAISAFRWTGRDGFQELIERLRTLSDAPPADVVPTLTKILSQIIEESSSSKMWDRIKQMEARMYHLGN